MSRRAVLLVNLGSPDSPNPGDVRSYLREFLMDERVFDAPWPVRFFVVHGCILPFRPARSAEAYRKIWTAQGSPLIAASRALQCELQKLVGLPVEIAMRYGNPSIAAAIQALKARNIEEMLLIPLFPHYAMSSFETAVEKVRETLARLAPEIALEVVRPYYDRPEYIDALAASASERLAKDYDHLLFSFHGIPERHLHKSDVTGCHCLKTKDCCLAPSPVHGRCYRAQCLKTMLAFAKKAGLAPSRFSFAFQSRLGRQPWLSPFTDQELARLAKAGVKKLLVISPSFVCDCLETLEEIGLRGRETFLAAGGEDLALVPCLNAHPLWIQTLGAMATEWQSTIADWHLAEPVNHKDRKEHIEKN